MVKMGTFSVYIVSSGEIHTTPQHWKHHLGDRGHFSISVGEPGGQGHCPRWMAPRELQGPKSRLQVGWRSQGGRRWADLKGPDQSVDLLSIPPSMPNWYFLSFIICLMCVPKADLGTSHVGWWFRKHLPMQGMRVQPLVRELRSHLPWGNYWAHEPQLRSHVL